MRTPLALLLLLSAAASAEEATRLLKDPEGRVTLTVPASYKDEAIAGAMIIHARAPGGLGGHLLTVFREEGQSDIDRQRDRYIQHDSPSYPGADLRKVNAPWFGYRFYDQAQNRVLLRAFVADGSDGLVIAVTSRFQLYDQNYAKAIDDIVSSVAFTTGAARNTSRTMSEGESRRFWDAKGVVSLMAPVEWKRIDPDEEGVQLMLALKGNKSGPRFTFKSWGGPSSAALILTRIFATWKRSYPNIQGGERVGDDPPRMLVRERVPGSVDYIIAFEQRGEAYTLVLTVREGGFESYRPLAEEIARSVVFADGGWKAAEPGPGAASATCKGVAVVMAPEAEVAEAVAKSLAQFDKQWGRVGVGDSKKAPPVRITVVPEAEFAGECHAFGAPPAVYDIFTRRVVALPPPADKEALAVWQGRLYAAVAHAAMHRDLPAGAPPWLRTGLMALMESAGRTGKGADEAHAVFAERIAAKARTDPMTPLESLVQLTNADFMNAESIDPQVTAWAYCHMMLFGKATLGGIYKRWVSEFEKSTTTIPPLDLSKYPGSADDLKKHVQKHWAK